uniref:TFIIB-type zinc ribbon-containing protein n=1 Tax=Actinosynnema sp. TaxID=1872144 RepID=UPI003F82A599
GAMRTYERNGVHIDQCTECRGVFLDRGELERLVDAEARWYGDETAPGGRSQPHDRADAQGHHPGHGAGDGRSGSQPHAQGGGQSSLGGMVGEVLQQVRAAQGGSRPGGHPRRKSSFLGDLLR